MENLEHASDEGHEMASQNTYAAIQPADFAKKTWAIGRTMKQTQQLQSTARELLKPPTTSPAPTSTALESTQNSLGRLRVLTSLSKTITFLTADDLAAARVSAMESLSRAIALKDQKLLARCQYWMGRVQFESDEMKEAMELFIAARSGLMDDDGPESETVQHYLDLSKRFMRKSQRKRERDQWPQYPVELGPIQLYSFPKKRKQEASTGKPVPHVGTEGKSGTWPKNSPHAGAMILPSDQHAWLIRDMADLSLTPQMRDLNRALDKVGIGMTNDDKSGQAGQPAPSPEEDLKPNVWKDAPASKPHRQRWVTMPPQPRLNAEFTMRCGPADLAPQAHPTTTSLKLPDETLLPRQDWDSQKTLMKQCAVTKAYLEREMELKALSKKKD